MSASFSVIAIVTWRLSKYVGPCFSLSLCAVLWYSGFSDRVLLLPTLRIVPLIYGWSGPDKCGVVRKA